MSNDGAAVTVWNPVVIGLWGLIEEEIQNGKKPDPRHIAEAIRQGLPGNLSEKLRQYLAVKLDSLYRAPRGRPTSKQKGVTAKTEFDNVRAAEDVLQMEKEVDTRRIAEAFRQGQPGELSAELRNYLAAKFDTLYRAPRGRPTSKGKQQVVARQLIALVDDLRAEEMVRGKRGSLERALQRAGAGDMKRRYRRALKQCGMTARRMP